MSLHYLWRTYLESHPDFEVAERLFLELENFLEALAAMYNFEADLPSIRLIESDEFGAWATDQGEILLPTGIFKHVDRYSELAADGYELPGPDPLVRFYRRFMLSWIVGHEFFHIARAHFEVMDLVGSEGRKAVEYDSDLMSIAGLYRYLRAMNPNAPVIQTKRMVLLIVFGPMRAQIGSAFADPLQCEDDYPSWHLRVYAALEKLCMLDVVKHREDAPDELISVMDQLLPTLLSAEEHYCKKHEIEVSLIVHFVQSNRYQVDFDSMIEIWEKIEPHINRLQKCDPSKRRGPA